MKDHKIEFNNIPWELISRGVKQKQFHTQNNRIRILRLEDGFEEKDWCINGHIGYLLAGEMTIDFAGNKVQYKSGDAFVIALGASNKHKAIISKGNFVELLLVEELQ